MHYLQQGGAWPSKLRTTILSKAHAVASDFVGLLREDCHFESTGCFGIIFNMHLPIIDACQKMAELVLLVASQALDFETRILFKFVDVFPWKLAWMTWQPASSPCGRRQELACQLLLASSMVDLDNDALAFKYRLLFERELLDTVATGRFDADLWQFTVDLFDMSTDNTQDIEGLNSIISQFAQ